MGLGRGGKREKHKITLIHISNHWNSEYERCKLSVKYLALVVNKATMCSYSKQYSSSYIIVYGFNSVSHLWTGLTSGLRSKSYRSYFGVAGYWVCGGSPSLHWSTFTFSPRFYFGNRRHWPIISYHCLMIKIQICELVSPLKQQLETFHRSLSSAWETRLTLTGLVPKSDPDCRRRQRDPIFFHRALNLSIPIWI